MTDTVAEWWFACAWFPFENVLSERRQPAYARMCVVIVSKNPSVLNTARTIPMRLSLNNAVFRLTMDYLLCELLTRLYEYSTIVVLSERVMVYSAFIISRAEIWRTFPCVTHCCSSRKVCAGRRARESLCF